MTATVVDAVVSSRLNTALGRPRPIAGHVVVVGLGNVGSRVVGQLHDLGVPPCMVGRCADLRVVLRLLDSDFAERVQRDFGITISRSVSYLAAPAFAAAMLECQVLGTIPVGCRVLLIVEVPIHAGSQLDGVDSHTVNAPRQAQVIAIHRHTTGTFQLPPPEDHRLTPATGW